MKMMFIIAFMNFIINEVIKWICLDIKVLLTLKVGEEGVCEAG
ncbi:MAG: hypothetical protein ACLS28_10265 [Clostridium neonatale]